MEDFKGNPNALKKPDERRITGPVTKDVKVKPANSGGRFFAQDLKTTTRGVTNEVFIPGIKNLFVNVLKKFVDYLFLGGVSQSNNNYINYNSVLGTPARVTYSNGFNQPVAPQQPIRQSLYSVNEVIFTDRGPAEQTLIEMNNTILRYGMVSVLDFYDLVGLPCKSTDNKYGWKNLETARVERTYDGYRIEFPRIIPLED